MPPPEIASWMPTNRTHPNAGRAYDPFEHADSLYIEVIFRPLRSGNEMWLPEHHTLVIKEGMRSVHQRTAAAHGIAHAVYGHSDDRPKHEFQADRLAANNLIDLAECRELIRWTPDCYRLAAELGVTTRLMRTFLDAHRLVA